jgi:hypothetical protein
VRSVLSGSLRAHLLWIVATVVLGSTARAHAEEPIVVNLRAVGYPSSCEFLSLDTYLFGAHYLEFLDSSHLLVKFPLQVSDCPRDGFSSSTDFRSVVIETSGKIAASQNWSRPQVSNLVAGPDGRIIEVVPGGIWLLDDSFHVVQKIGLPQKNFPPSTFPSTWAIQLAPSRHAFAAVYPEFIGRGFNGLAVYFAGPQPFHQTMSLDTDNVLVGDGVLLPANWMRGQNVDKRSVELNAESYSCQDGYWIAVLPANRPVCLTAGYKLVALTPEGGRRLIADVHSLAPGSWNSWFGYLTTNEAAQRLLLDSVGVRFPVTDSWGLGGYRNIAVYDLNSGQQVFRKGIPFKSAIAISPDGHLVAVEEKAKISIYHIP